MFAEDYAAEEELLLSAADVSPVSSALRKRVLLEARKGLRRRQARREMSLVAAGLLGWMLLTHAKTAPRTMRRALQVAVTSWRGDGGDRADDDAKVFAYERRTSRRDLAQVETWRLDDLLAVHSPRAGQQVAEPASAIGKQPALETMRTQWRELVG